MRFRRLRAILGPTSAAATTTGRAPTAGAQMPDAPSYLELLRRKLGSVAPSAVARPAPPRGLPMALHLPDRAVHARQRERAAGDGPAPALMHAPPQLPPPLQRPPGAGRGSALVAAPTDAAAKYAAPASFPPAQAAAASGSPPDRRQPAHARPGRAAALPSALVAAARPPDAAAAARRPASAAAAPPIGALHGGTLHSAALRAELDSRVNKAAIAALRRAKASSQRAGPAPPRVSPAPVTFSTASQTEPSACRGGSTLPRGAGGRGRAPRTAKEPCRDTARGAVGCPGCLVKHEQVARLSRELVRADQDWRRTVRLLEGELHTERKQVVALEADLMRYARRVTPPALPEASAVRYSPPSGSAEAVTASHGSAAPVQELEVHDEPTIADRDRDRSHQPPAGGCASPFRPVSAAEWRLHLSHQMPQLRQKIYSPFTRAPPPVSERAPPPVSTRAPPPVPAHPGHAQPDLTAPATPPASRYAQAEGAAHLHTLQPGAGCEDPAGDGRCEQPGGGYAACESAAPVAERRRDSRPSGGLEEGGDYSRSAGHPPRERFVSSRLGCGSCLSPSCISPSVCRAIDRPGEGHGAQRPAARWQSTCRDAWAPADASSHPPRPPSAEPERSAYHARGGGAAGGVTAPNHAGAPPARLPLPPPPSLHVGGTPYLDSVAARAGCPAGTPPHASSPGGVGSPSVRVRLYPGPQRLCAWGTSPTPAVASPPSSVAVGRKPPFGCGRPRQPPAEPSHRHPVLGSARTQTHRLPVHPGAPMRQMQATHSRLGARPDLSRAEPCPRLTCADAPTPLAFEPPFRWSHSNGRPLRLYARHPTEAWDDENGRGDQTRRGGQQRRGDQSGPGDQYRGGDENGRGDQHRRGDQNGRGDENGPGCQNGPGGQNGRGDQNRRGDYAAPCGGGGRGAESPLGSHQQGQARHPQTEIAAGQHAEIDAGQHAEMAAGQHAETAVGQHAEITVGRDTGGAWYSETERSGVRARPGEARGAESDSRAGARGSPPSVPLPSPPIGYGRAASAFKRPRDVSPRDGSTSDVSLRDVSPGDVSMGRAATASAGGRSHSWDGSLGATTAPRGPPSWSDNPLANLPAEAAGANADWEGAPLSPAQPRAGLDAGRGSSREWRGSSREWPGSSCGWRGPSREWPGSNREWRGSSTGSSSSEWPGLSAMRNPRRDSSAPSHRSCGNSAGGIHRSQADGLGVKPRTSRELVANSRAALLSTERPPKLKPVRALFREE